MTNETMLLNELLNAQKKANELKALELSLKILELIRAEEGYINVADYIDQLDRVKIKIGKIMNSN